MTPWESSSWASSSLCVVTLGTPERLSELGRGRKCNTMLWVEIRIKRDPPIMGQVELGILTGFIAKKIIMRSQTTLKHLSPTPSQLFFLPRQFHIQAWQPQDFWVPSSEFLGSQPAAFEASVVGERLRPHSIGSGILPIFGVFPTFPPSPLVPVGMQLSHAGEKQQECAGEISKGFNFQPSQTFHQNPSFSALNSAFHRAEVRTLAAGPGLEQ